jgi:hypothetical protein
MPTISFRPSADGTHAENVERPLGTINAWMGTTRFLARTIERVITETSLHVLAYNM